MKLRITKKEKPYMRIACAMLYKKKNFKKNDRIENLSNNKLGRIEKLSSSTVSVVYDDKTREEFDKAEANKVLDVIKVERVQQVTSQQVAKSNKPSSKADRIAAVLQEAVRKKEIEPDDVEVKRLELETYSDEQLAEYEQEISSCYDESSADVPEERTEAEKTLDRLRANGMVETQSVTVVDNSPRSLKEAKENYEYDKQESMMLIDSSSFSNDGLSLDVSLDELKSKIMPREASFTRPRDHAMQNLHGMTKPIVQPTSDFKLKDALSSIEWTTLGKK